ncbi:hypothetical protein [Hydrococcus rivularis]|uniref:hypothetical protein n=1 Tax=Hydrococcus rivularis TaxID=1616834 RepID=UPI000AD5052F|nr:hypothetical protein [Hydrococcus rivularis]
MTEMVDRPHPQPLSQIGKKNVDRENMKIGIIRYTAFPFQRCVGAALTSSRSNLDLLARLWKCLCAGKMPALPVMMLVRFGF